MALTKMRLTLLVVLTTLFGFYISPGTRHDWLILLNTLLGSAMAALGSSIFNQLMEMEPDALMARTASRPLPARHISPAVAFILGGLLCAFGVIHLIHTVNLEATALTALTLITYIFIYTPLKQKSSVNTLVGAVSGALPPLIGWAAAYGPPATGEAAFRWPMFMENGALYLFALLFFWQLPHFVAINWMHRHDYERGGFVMWGNQDESGVKSARLCLLFSLLLAATSYVPLGHLHHAWAYALIMTLANLQLLRLAWRFYERRERPAARALFLYTLAYLPVAMLAGALFYMR